MKRQTYNGPIIITSASRVNHYVKWRAKIIPSNYCDLEPSGGLTPISGKLFECREVL
jgi:hypothetical protein